MSTAPEPCCTAEAGHVWEEVAVEPGRLPIVAALCAHCAARRFVYRHATGTVTRYARPPRWGVPADLVPQPLLTGTALPLPETALEREQRQWRERRAALTPEGRRA